MTTTKFQPTVALVLIIGALFLASCSLGDNPIQSTEKNGSSSSGTTDEYTEHESGESEIDPIEMARRRAALRTIIRKGDYYQVKNNAEQAITYYEKAHTQLKDDPKVAIRLANAYLDVKRFTDAANVFSKLDIRQFDEPSKRKIITSIMLDGNRTDTAEIIEKLPFHRETKEYLILVDSCAKKPEECSEKISNSNSASVEIQALKKAMQGDLASEDPTYKEAILTGELFKQKSYLASFRLAKYILARRPDYLAVIKMGGYSAYELGDYKESSTLLQRYYSSRTTDIDVAYMLGVVNFYLEDYVTSNLYFNNAVLNGYTPKEELERRLIYNYVLLGDYKGAYKVFRYLLDSTNVTAEDFQVALFMADTGNERSKEHLWSQKGLQAFPNDPYILGFAAGVSRKNEEYDAALQYLTAAKGIDENNPLVGLELCKLYTISNKLIDAQESCEKTIANDQGGYFAKQAETQLASVKELLNGSGGVITNTGSELMANPSVINTLTTNNAAATQTTTQPTMPVSENTATTETAITTPETIPSNTTPTITPTMNSSGETVSTQPTAVAQPIVNGSPLDNTPAANSNSSQEASN